MRTRIAVLFGAVLTFVACATDSESTTTTSTTSTVPSTTTTEPATTTGPTTTTTLAATTTTTQAIDVYLEGGQVVGPERFSFSIGDQVSIWVLSDTSDEIHVHGYDVSFEAAAGVPTEVAFIAEVPGIFEVEMEVSETSLFELEVTS